MSKLEKFLVFYAAVDLSSHAIGFIRWLWKKREYNNKCVDVEYEEILDDDGKQ